MMKTEERSPTPNHRIASGIQASAEIGRTISTRGANARPPRRYQARRIPSGTPTETASRYPHVTRKSDATTCLKRNPFCASSPIARATASGPGSSGTRPNRIARSQRIRSSAIPANGRSRDFESFKRARVYLPGRLVSAHRLEDDGASTKKGEPMRIARRVFVLSTVLTALGLSPVLAADTKNFESSPQVKAYRNLLKVVDAGDFEGYKKCMTKEASAGIDKQIKETGMDPKQGMVFLKAM